MGGTVRCARHTDGAKLTGEAGVAKALAVLAEAVIATVSAAHSYGAVEAGEPGCAHALAVDTYAVHRTVVGAASRHPEGKGDTLSYTGG
eukprot:81333-Amorphochlora_amoeboformis.AAC.1